MKKIFLYLSIIFMVLTFIAIGSVLVNKGSINAGYAIIPMIFALIFRLLYKNH